jgi:hypothetical protein
MYENPIALRTGNRYEAQTGYMSLEIFIFTSLPSVNSLISLEVILSGQENRINDRGGSVALTKRHPLSIRKSWH